MWSKFDAGKYEDSANEDAGDRPDGIEGLREIEPTLRGLRISALRYKRIGSSLEKRQAARDYEQRHQKKPITSDDRSWPEQKCSRSKQKQANDESGFVSKPLHDQGRRNRENEIPHVKSRLNQSRLKSRNCERLHELSDQYVIEVIRNAPKKEKSRDKHKRQDIT